MTKVSTNAGKHPYLRPDITNLFDEILDFEKGLPIDHKKQPFFKVEIATEYFDKNNENIFFKDIVTYQKDSYIVDYNHKISKWVLINQNDETKVEILGKIANLVVLKEKYNK